MRTDPGPRSATILMFPTAARSPAVNLSNKAKFAAELAALEGRTVACADAWYHQEAVAQERQGRRPGREH